jgi:hypothetical protein
MSTLNLTFGNWGRSSCVAIVPKGCREERLRLVKVMTRRWITLEPYVIQTSANCRIHFTDRSGLSTRLQRCLQDVAWVLRVIGTRTVKSMMDTVLQGLGKAPEYGRMTIYGWLRLRPANDRCRGKLQHYHVETVLTTWGLGEPLRAHCFP